MRILTALALSLWTAVAAAADLDALARELMVRSGLDKQIDAFPALVQLGLQQAQAAGTSPLPEGEFRALESATVRAFDPAPMKTTVLASLKKALTGPDIEAALAWLNSPLGRRITALEEAAGTAEAYQQRQAWEETLARDPPPPARAAQIRRLDKAAGVTEFTMSALLNSQLALVAALTATQPVAQQKRAFEGVRGAFEQNRAQIRQNAEEQSFVSMLYSYRSLPDGELEQYVAFAESPAGRKYQLAAIGGLDEAIVRACHNAGRVIGDSLKSKKTET